MADSTPMLGSIMLFAGNFAPKGFQLCNGQILSIAQNSALFALLGTTYGGNGQTTFALPDLRGRAPVQQGQGPGLAPVTLGQVSGRETVTLLTTNLPAHTHALNGNTTASDGAMPANNLVLSNFGDNSAPINGYSTAQPNTTLAPTSVGASGGGQPVPVRNPFTGLNYIIAVQGFFPSRN